MAEPMRAGVDLGLEQRKIRRGVLKAFVLTLAALGLSQFFLPRLVGLTGESLEHRLTFWAGSSLFLILWVLVGVGMVSTGRRYSEADIRGSAYAPPSPKIAVAAAFLQNTLEQAFVAIGSQLALLLLVGAAAYPFIAASTLLFGVGRVTFLQGYPSGAGARSFGMALTALPSLFAYCISLIALIARLIP